jgi:YHS domain-containing protein
MTKCDGCGEPIGHAKTILKEYHSGNLEKKDYYFGSKECQRVFEKANDVVPEVECANCGELVKETEMVEAIVTIEGVRVKQPFHPDCQREVDE